MTDLVKPIRISYDVAEGAGDLYLATVSLLTMRLLVKNEIERVEVVIADAALAEDARNNWALIEEMEIDIVDAPTLTVDSIGESDGFLISGAPVLLPRQPLVIENGFRIVDGNRIATCVALDGSEMGASPGGMEALRPKLGASSQIERHIFADIGTEEFTELRKDVRLHHHNGYFWDFRYRTNPGLGSGIGSRGIYQMIKRELLNRNVVAADLSVVDIGCGDLEVCRFLSFKSYLGVDEAPQALELGRSKRPDWSFQLAPLDTRNGPVADVAICFEVVIHAPSAESAKSLIETLAASASKRIIISGYDFPIPESSIVYFHAPLREMLESLPGWKSPVLLTRYENLSVYAVDREEQDLPVPEPFGSVDADPFTWDALTKLERSINEKWSRLSGNLARILDLQQKAQEKRKPQPSRSLTTPSLAPDGPIISIVCAYRNEEARIGKMLESLALQGEPGFEVHLVDDGSDDGSNDLVSGFVKKDPRFIHHENKVSLGPSARRNQGIQAARGKYLFFIDGDDELTANALETLLDTSLRTGSDVVRGSHIFQFAEGEQSVNVFDQYHQPELEGVTYAAMPSLVFLYTAWNMLVDRNVILGNGLQFDPKLKLGEDRLFNQELFSVSRSISLTKQVTYRWIRERNSQRQLSFSESPGARIESVLAYLILFDSLPGATTRHRELAHAAMYWEMYRSVLVSSHARALNKTSRISLSQIVDMLDFPDELLLDPTVKGWEAKEQSRARALYLRMQRGRL